MLFLPLTFFLLSLPVSEKVSAAEKISASTKLGAYSGTEVRGARLFPFIAYAKPPLASLRWKRPVAETKAIQRKDAVECHQVIGDSLPSNKIPLPQSEDCLYLNVWAPKDGINHPVVFLIHGGGLLAGSGLKDFYDGSVFARQNTVFVSFNYRLGELGYGPNLEKEPGSLGLMDQGLALDWVTKHIEAFGGDPENIYLMGHSKGAEAVTALAISGLAGPGVKGGFAFSGPRQFDVGVRPMLQKFWPGEEKEEAQSILTKKGFFLYVPDLPFYRDQYRDTPTFQLLASSLYDEGSTESGSEMYCSNLHFLEQLSPFIKSYHYVWHTPEREHGAEMISLFSEDAFGKKIMLQLQSFLRKGVPLSLSTGHIPLVWKDSPEVIHIYPSFSFADSFKVPPMPPGGVNYASKVRSLCLDEKYPGSKISPFYYWFERFLRLTQRVFRN